MVPLLRLFPRCHTFAFLRRLPALHSAAEYMQCITEDMRMLPSSRPFALLLSLFTSPSQTIIATHVERGRVFLGEKRHSRTLVMTAGSQTTKEG